MSGGIFISKPPSFVRWDKQGTARHRTEPSKDHERNVSPRLQTRRERKNSFI